jgi:integrase/recombinase XerD
MTELISNEGNEGNEGKVDREGREGNERNQAKRRIPPKQMARQLARHLRSEHPDYDYLKQVFRCLRAEMDIEIPRMPKRLPYVPNEEQIRRYYQAVWQSRNFNDMVLIKTLLYTGVRVSELVSIRLADVDLDRCQIKVVQGKGGKDRVVPFPAAFKETLGMHMERMREKGAVHLFESSWKKRYSDRGVRRMLERYAEAAGLERNVSPHQLRHFLLTWLKKQGIDDALIQPYSGHASRQSLEIYSRLAIGEAQREYDQVIGRFPI